MRGERPMAERRFERWGRTLICSKSLELKQTDCNEAGKVGQGMVIVEVALVCFLWHDTKEGTKNILTIHHLIVW